MTATSDVAGATTEASHQAEAAQRSAAGGVLARGGLAARGLLYLVLAVLIVEVVAGRSDREADGSGALRSIVARPLGAVLVGLLAVCFAGHAVWRLLTALTAARPDEDAGGRAHRLMRGLPVIVYAGLAAASVSVVAGRSRRSEDATARQGAADALGLPLGRPLVIAVGIAVGAVGVGLAVWAVRRGYRRNLEVADMSRVTARLVDVLEVWGHASRAVLVVCAGGLIVDAGVRNEPGRAQGVDGTLHTLAAQSGGAVLLVGIAAGLAAFAVASGFEARYER